jgi:hypothetical protein
MLHRTASVMASALLLTLTTSLPAQSRADLDRNGALEVADLQEFHRLFEVEDRRADFNRDGAHDLFDLLEFQNQFAAGAGEPDATSHKLYLGVAGHWQDTVPPRNLPWTDGHEFGPTELNYRWFDQGRLSIRPARRYPGSGHPEAGTGAWMTWAEVDPPSSTWQLRRGGLSGTAAFGAWKTAALSNIADSLAVDPISSGRKMQLDNETLHFFGWYWGRMMQAQTYLMHQRYGMGEEAYIAAHSQAFLPIGIDFMHELQTEYPDDEFTWYNLPVRRNWSLSGAPASYSSDGYHGDPDPPSEGSYPWYGVDILMEDLLDACDYIDGNVYTGGPVHAAADWRAYWEGQIGRKKAIADDLGKPFMARVWLENGNNSTLLQNYGYLKDFFEVCADASINATEAATDAGRHTYECACELAGMTYGTRWNTLVVAAAYDAGFLTDPPVTDLTLVSSTPESGNIGQQVNVTLRGSDFGNGLGLSMSGSGVSISNVTVVDGETATAVLTIIQSAATGSRDLTVTIGSDSWTLADAFEILPVSGTAPAPIGFHDSNGMARNCVAPGNVKQGTSATIRIGGRHFQNGCTVAASGSDVTVGSVTFLSSRRIEFVVTVDSSGTPDTTRAITVTNPDSQTATDWEFEVVAP